MVSFCQLAHACCTIPHCTALPASGALPAHGFADVYKVHSASVQLGLCSGDAAENGDCAPSSFTARRASAIGPAPQRRAFQGSASLGSRGSVFAPLKRLLSGTGEFGCLVAEHVCKVARPSSPELIYFPEGFPDAQGVFANEGW
jgi:hypothetical protein